jgi:hypothetical protein
MAAHCAQGKKQTFRVFDYKGPGVAMAMYNTEQVRLCSRMYLYLYLHQYL